MLNCPDHVERLAAYGFRWIDGILDPKFSRSGWRDEPNYLAVYLAPQFIARRCGLRRAPSTRA